MTRNEKKKGKEAKIAPCRHKKASGKKGGRDKAIPPLWLRRSFFAAF